MGDADAGGSRGTTSPTTGVSTTSPTTSATTTDPPGTTGTGDEPPPKGSCCEPTGAAGCTDPAVEMCVCAMQSDCCDPALSGWDEFCVALVEDLQCGSCMGMKGECCEVHAAAGCNDPSVEECVCMVPGNEACCEIQWNEVCVAVIDNPNYCNLGYCVGMGGTDTGGATKGPCCQANSTPGCDDPTVESCVCAADATCCSEPWDDFCVVLVEGAACGACS
jgi:hypothetical protein